MPSASGSDSDTIRILLATDNHVGYNERDPIRGDDSWKSFHEVLCIAKERDVDMVLLAGDLFHDNKPSRKAMYQCMRSLRMNCYGEKPCELEVLSDVSTNLQGAFNHVNYEDPDINVSIPVFSIHGNHDDPSGEGRLCALDLLQCAGLINYFGRAPENDNIVVSPILMQKGHTKLALYGLSNVRDERLFRTFRDGKVKFLRPGTQMSEWFNLMAVHQNHQAHTDTGYLPENFLQDFLDLVVWGHEHECIIEPRVNPEMGFSVVQPGSSVATALAQGESVSKHVGLLTINRKEFNIEPIRLKTVRPFIMKDITLSDDKSMRKVAKESENRAEVTRYLEAIVYQMIEAANKDWLAVQEEENSEIDTSELKVPLPLIRLRVEYTALDGGNYEIENPQRFSNRFVGKVANTNDVVQFYRRKATATRSGKTSIDDDESKVNALLEAYAKPEDIRVEELVKEFLTAQSLNILPQNGLGDAVSQFIDKSDIHAVETFVTETLRTQFKKVQEYNASTEEEIQEAMESAKKSLEQLFEKGDPMDKSKKKTKTKKVRAPDHDSDLDGHFDENDVDDDVEIASESAPESEPEPAPPSKTKAAARGRARGGRAAPAAAARKPAAKKKAAAKAPIRGKGKKAAVSSEEEEEEEQDEDEDDDIVIPDNEDSDLEMIDNDEDEVMPQRTTTRGGRKTTTPAKTTTKSAPKKAAPSKKASASAWQSILNFSSQTPAATRSRRPPSDDDVEDEDDDFQPMESSTRRRR